MNLVLKTSRVFIVIDKTLQKKKSTLSFPDPHNCYIFGKNTQPAWLKKLYTLVITKLWIYIIKENPASNIWRSYKCILVIAVLTPVLLLSQWSRMLLVLVSFFFCLGIYNLRVCTRHLAIGAMSGSQRTVFP